MTVSTSASRSIASPALRMTPQRNSAPEATTCTAGIASASAHGQVMISTAMAVTSASCTEAPATSQPISGQRRGRMHDRRIEPRRAVGEAHDSASWSLTAFSSSRSTSSISVPVPAAVTRIVSAPEKFTAPA